MTDITDVLRINSKKYRYTSLEKAKKLGLTNIDLLPKTLKILLENVLRKIGDNNRHQTVQGFNDWLHNPKSTSEISFYPARVIMQDFTGVPAIVDLAALRSAAKLAGKNPNLINPQIPVDLIIDHSLTVDHFGHELALDQNESIEYKRNYQRYRFLKWAQKAFKNLRIIPPSTGIIHQINLEYLAKLVWKEQDDLIYPDTLVGTDSHTTMIGALAILGWGVGGIEAESAMLGKPISLNIPQVIGVKLHGALPNGVSATDAVLTIVEILRKNDVVGKMVEFFGPGFKTLSLYDRAVIANMSPEYGATCGFFPLDQRTLSFLKTTGRSDKWLTLVEQYAKKQGLWFSEDDMITFSDTLEIDLSSLGRCIAGPKKPMDRVDMEQSREAFSESLVEQYRIKPSIAHKRYHIAGQRFSLGHGDVVLASITSCTNTAHPFLMITAGLVAKKACQLGLKVKPWVKTSLAPGSRVVSEYLKITGLQGFLDKLGFHLVGYGCATCIGNSGPLDAAIIQTINQNRLITCSVTSGNRNFEGRINPHTKANYLASPAVVIIYALTGTMNIDLYNEPIGISTDGDPVYFSDLWPAQEEIDPLMQSALKPDVYRRCYSEALKGNAKWDNIVSDETKCYNWDKDCTYIQKPPFFNGFRSTEDSSRFNINKAAILAIFGDNVTTDHISPAGPIAKGSPAAKYLTTKGIRSAKFNSYGSRRGNHEVMVRGAFTNDRIQNKLLPEKEGGYTIYHPTREVLTIYDTAMRYAKHHTPLVIIAGKNYGIGSSRDWAAKGTYLLGVRAVIAESFERIHRSNLVYMGILPLQFESNTNMEIILTNPNADIFIHPLTNDPSPMEPMICVVKKRDRILAKFKVISRIDTSLELSYFKTGGILNHILQQLGAKDYIDPTFKGPNATLGEVCST